MVVIVQQDRFVKATQSVATQRY